jgi:Uma2 family endonuclease
LVWVVDTERKSVTTYRPQEAARRTDASGVLDGEDVLPGLSIPLVTIFER